MMPIWLAARALAKGVPWWLWVGAALLAWGGWQRHRAQSVERMHTKAVAEAAAAREAQLLADAAETERRRRTQEGIANAAKQKAQVLATDVARARDAERRLLDKLAAVEAFAGAGNPTAPGGSTATGETVTVLADMLQRCVKRVRELAEYADGASAAGEACEKSYDALTHPR